MMEINNGLFEYVANMGCVLHKSPGDQILGAFWGLYRNQNHWTEVMMYENSFSYHDDNNPRSQNIKKTYQKWTKWNFGSFR